MDQVGKALQMLLVCCCCFFCLSSTLAQGHGGRHPSLAVDVGGYDALRQVQTYIVFVQKPDNLVFGSHEEREEWHKSFLPSPNLDSGDPRLVYSYEDAITGFAARLTPDEVVAMEAKDGFLYAVPDEQLKPRTTHTPKFLGLTRAGRLWEQAKKGEGMVIGVLDAGFQADHPSFKGAGMKPPPASWTGRCDFDAAHCNNKLIGTRMFNKSGAYVPDEDGVAHGTHVASTAAGNFVPGASNLGHASGTAVGVAPRAHLAFYAPRGVADWVGAVDQAIRDGIDVLSISIGLSTALPFHRDPMAIATLSAVRRRVFVSVAAGNDGPAPGTMLDNEPWTLTVGASTTDRVVRVNLKLGDGRVIPGESPQIEYLFPAAGSLIPAAFPGGSTGDDSVKNCHHKDFGGVDVSGKVVLCLRNDIEGTTSDYARGCNVAGAGGKAMVLMNKKVHGSSIKYDFACIPLVLVGYNESGRLKNYVMSARNPTISIEPEGTVYGLPRNPAVADFSARGPSSVSNGVLKPDILGPGVNILGAYTSESRPFVFMPGTSMACPHLSGIAALLRSSHSDWTPAMVKSAIMTTADRVDNSGLPIADETGNPADLFATGAGHVNGTRADDPGLVYDIEYRDYVKYVCGLGYTPAETNAVISGNVDCSVEGQISGEELNYPSFSVSVSSTVKSIERTVTNVGPGVSSYTLSVEQPTDVWVNVFPRRLDFTRARQKRSYTVTFVATNPNRTPGETEAGQLTWTSANHAVRSPISVTFA